jgi:hypothetical protein
MSTVYGVPPPPRPSVLQSGPTRKAAPPRRRVVDRDPQPWRRRGVSLLTLLAATLLLLANVGGWLHFVGLDADATAPPAAAASLDAAQDEAAAVAVPAVLERVTARYAASGTPVPSSLTDDVTDAVYAALETPEFAQAWEDAVHRLLEREIRAVEDADRDPFAVSEPVQLDLATIAPAVSVALVDRGYPLLDAETLSPGTYTLPPTASDGVPYGPVGALAQWWWLALLGAIALGAAAIVLARRPLRLAGFLAADVVLVLAVTLVLVPLVGQVVGEFAADERHTELIEDAYGGAVRSLLVQTVVLMVVAAVAAVVCLVLARRRDARERA